MTNVEKTQDLIKEIYPSTSMGDYGLKEMLVLEAMKWKDEQLNQAFDKALEHHSNKLKEGKITQYGMDNVFAFVENVRYFLEHGC